MVTWLWVKKKRSYIVVLGIFELSHLKFSGMKLILSIRRMPPYAQMCWIFSSLFLLILESFRLVWFSSGMICWDC